MGASALGNRLEFLLVFWINMFPELVASDIAEEGPSFLGMMGIEKLESGEQVSDFWSEEISVLIADLAGEPSR